MKKIMNGKIIETTDETQVAERTSHHSASNNPIGWETIHLIDGIYYLQTTGGNDIYSPRDNIQEIGVGCRDSLLPYVEGTDWAMDDKIIEHIETTLKG